mgnify:CR=1 FL=1
MAPLQIPEEFYRVVQYPAPLAGMRLPHKDFPWNHLHALGYQWVVCLCSDHPVYDPTPLSRLVAVELCDMLEVDLPEDPEMEEKGIQIIAEKILEKLESGEGVLVHCAGGRGRTGTVIGSVLKKLGYETAEIISQLDLLNKKRGKAGWPESSWQSEVVARAEASPL